MSELIRCIRMLREARGVERARLLVRMGRRIADVRQGRG